MSPRPAARSGMALILTLAAIVLAGGLALLLQARALSLSRAGVNILGTSPDAIDRAEDRARFRELLDKLGLRQAESGMAHSVEEALTIASAITYPVMVRPSSRPSFRDGGQRIAPPESAIRSRPRQLRPDIRRGPG